MVTARAIQGISDNIQVELLNDEGMKVTKKLSEATLKNATFAQLLSKNMVSAIASATISSAVNGGSLEDSLKASLISAFIDTAAANGANWICDVTQDEKLSQTLAENFANKLMHGVLGCAIGGIVGYATADALDGFNLDPSQLQELGKLTSVLAGLLAKQDLQGLNISMGTAQTAIANHQ